MGKKRRVDGKLLREAKDTAISKKLHKKKAKKKLSIQELKEALPLTYHNHATDEFLKVINKRIKGYKEKNLIRDNVLGFAGVLEDGKYKMSNYLDVVTFASYKTMQFTDVKAWRRTFPEKYKRLKKAGKSSKYISSVVNGFVKGKLVQEVLAQTVYPAHIFYADIFHKSVLAQAKLLKSKNEYIRQKAAGDLMKELKPPEPVEGESLQVESVGADMIKELIKTTGELAKLQSDQIKSGGSSISDILGAKIINTDYTVKDEG